MILLTAGPCKVVKIPDEDRGEPAKSKDRVETGPTGRKSYVKILQEERQSKPLNANEETRRT